MAIWNSKRFLIILAVSVALLAALGIGVDYFLNWYFCPTPTVFHAPSDAKITATFRQHRAEFVELAKMLKEDSRKGLSVGPARSSDGPIIKEPRWQAYLALLSQIGPKLELGCISEDNQRDMEIIFARSGGTIFDDEYSKGIDYILGSIESKGKLAPNLDHREYLPAGHYLCPIEPNWYISYDFYKE
jgi:hypothetical protein